MSATCEQSVSGACERAVVGAGTLSDNFAVHRSRSHTLKKSIESESARKRNRVPAENRVD